MIERYSLAPMKALWSEEAKYERWLQVELAVLEAQAALGQVPAEAVEAARARARVDSERIAAIEAEIKHDVLAFVRALEETIGPEGRWLHLGLTASDVVDTANALALREAFDLVLAALDALLETTWALADGHRRTLMAGRTHGMHAEPISFGLKVLSWYAQLIRDRERCTQARERAAVGKISGSVGTYANVDPEVERRACEALGLQPDPISNQVVQRDRHAESLNALAVFGATVERIVVELRHLSRTEVGELRERGAHRSSSMPHKKNPIAAETMSGLARLLRTNAQAELESVALWHERDISNSSVERIVLPDSFTLAHYLAVRLERLLGGIEPDAERMRANLGLTHGLVYSQAVLLALIRAGMPRAEAHERLRDLAFQVGPERPLRALLVEDERIAGFLDPNALDALFDPERSLQHVDTVFARFGGH